MWSKWRILTVAVGFQGCTVLAPGEPEPLVAVRGWERVVGAADPFAGEGGSDEACDVAGVQVYNFGSELSLDVGTDKCPRVTMAQPALRAIGEGDVIALRGWHEPLTATAPAEAVVALAIDGEELWRAAYPIPSESGPMLGELAAPRAFPAGAQVAWHLHNHGKNSYHLFEVVVRPLVPSEAP